MQWVRKTEESGRVKSVRRIAEDLDLPQSTVNKLVTQVYPECFIIEPYVSIILTGKWPNDIAFDWETLKPLENLSVEARFRAPKDGFTPKDKPKKIDWTGDVQYGLESWNKIITLEFPMSVEQLVDLIEADLYQEIVDGLNAIAFLFEARGKQPKPGFFHKTTGLHYKKEST
jgi:hypothetical protein